MCRQLWPRRKQLLCLLQLIVAVRLGWAQDLPSQFIIRNAASGRNFDLPVGIAFAPGNRIFVAEKRGKVFVIHNGSKISTPFIDLESEVLSNESQGLLGIAVDPDFLNNRWVYLVYVVDPTGGLDNDAHAFSRLVRYRAKSANLNEADLTTRQILIGNSWGDGIIACSGQHVIGALRFGSDGTLLVSSGEASVSGVGPDAGGHHPECFGPGKFDPAEDIGAFRAQYLHSLAGKILRIDKETGLGLPSNPYYTGNPADNKSKVWAYGVRNPFRFGIRPNGSANPADGRPGTLYIGDVGWGQYEDINLSKAGGGENFGWPCFEGPREVSGYQRANPAHSDCNSIGTSENPAEHTLPLVYYHHTDPNLSSPKGITGSSVTGGVFYTGSKYPAQYRGAYFFADYEISWIRVLRVDQNDNFVELLNFAEFPGDRFQHGIVDFATDPVTGDVFYVDITTGEVMQISYTGATENEPPVAIASANKLSGPVPLTVNFTGSDSFDPDGDPITFQWDFGDGGSSTQTNPSHTYNSAGVFSVKLTVRDNQGASSDFFLEIIAGSEPPIPVISSPANGLAVFPNETIFLQGSAVDPDEPESNLQFRWEIDQHHKDHVHPDALTFTGKTASFVPGNHGDPWDYIYLGIKLKVTDSSGLTGVAESFVVIKVVGETDITDSGSPIALITNPSGSGNPDIGVIKDNVFPAAGSSDPFKQYDTNTGGGSRPEDWIGYEFNELHNFSKLIFQEGINFSNGGWFESLAVEVRRDGVWQPVFFLNSVPPYSKNNGVNYESFSLLFAPQKGDAIRIKGDPGGSNNFISVGELRVIESPFEAPESATLVFEPMEDSFVRSNYPTNNYGASVDLRARKTSSAEHIVYLKFSVAGVSGAVQNAKLRLYVTDASDHGGDVYAAANNFQGTSTLWTESGLNWNNAPTISGPVLSSLGSVAQGTTIEHNVTSAISGDGMYTFAIRSRSTDVLIFDSKESIQAPQLVIETEGGGTPPLPQISSFTPTSGSMGTVVTISGNNFAGAIEVRFGDVAAANYSIDSDTQIRATVPTSAVTGRIRVTTPAGTATSAADFTVQTAPEPLPAISGFSPTSGPVGTSVTVLGSNFTGASEVAFNNVAAVFAVISDGEIHTTAPAGATTGKISVTTPAGTAISSTNFTVTTAGGGDEIILRPNHDVFVRSNDPAKNYGTSGDLRLRKTSSAELISYFKFNITGAGSVQSAVLRLFVTDASNSGGEMYLASNFLKGTSTPWTETSVIWTNAPEINGAALASLGAVTQNSVVEFDLTSVITGDGEYSFALRTTSSDLVNYASKETANPPQLILMLAPSSPNAPSIASFSPNSGEVGTAVTISGQNFTGATEVTFNSVAAVFSVESNQSIVATAPAGATSGRIRVTTPEGTATSSSDFTVITPPPPIPVISEFSPTSGEVGDAVTISGSNFTGASEVAFNNTAAAFSVISDGEIHTSVPAGATTGKISVTNADGTGASASNFTVVTSGGGNAITLLPNHDVFVRSNDPAKNYGTSGDLRLRKTSSAELISYFKFNITGAGSVQSAILRLFVTDASNSGGEMYLASNFLKGTSTPWTETSVIWTNAPEINGAALASLGAVTQNSVVEFDLTSAITGDGEYSFALRTTSSDLAIYASKETANPPQLLLNGGGGPPPANLPTISSFTPTSGLIGASVTILGSHFTGATLVRFNGVSATFTIVSDGEIRATVPAGASSGKISVTNADGSATSSADFTVAAGDGGSQTVIFNPTDDAFVWSASPDNNSGSSTNLRVRKTSATQIAFFKFNVTGLTGAVTSAKLRLLCTDPGDDGGGVYSVSNSWNESTLTWSNAPAVSGSAISAVQAVSLNLTVEWDVTLAISGDGIYSFAIRNNSSDAVYYSSKEGSQTPELVIVTGSGASIAAKLGDEDAGEFAESEIRVESPVLPETLTLQPNYPNPFNAETTIEYGLPQASQVRLAIYNVRGQEVRILVDEYQSAGFRSVRWDGRDQFGVEVSSGWYVTRFVVGERILTGKLVLQK